ncbi:MAG: PD40 domain-containing protein [Deltaproteobacteria bacterium]|nr:PD40 domain-containing protein [Deltaproteobacteria bacterium]
MVGRIATLLLCALASVAHAETELDLRILDPPDGHVFEPGSSHMIVRGVLRGDPAATLRLNGSPIQRSGAHWTFGLDLVVGLNGVEVVATDAHGRRVVERLRVRLRDPRHGLELAADKRGLREASGAWPDASPERLDFVDTTTGAPVRRLTADSSIDRPHYTDHSTWSANGDTLVFRSDRTPAGSWLVGADGAAPQFVDSRPVQWDALDPRILYAVTPHHRDRKKLWSVIRLHTGSPRDKSDVLFEIPGADPKLTASILDVHADGRKLLASIGNQNRSGISNAIYLVDTGDDETVGFRAPGTTHRVLFTGSADYDFFIGLAADRAGRGPASNWCGSKVAPEQCRRAAEGGFLVEDPLDQVTQRRRGLAWIATDAICRISSEKISHPAFPPGGGRILASYGQNLFDAEDRWRWHRGIAISELSCAGDLGLDSNLTWGLARDGGPNPGHRSWNVDADWVVAHSGRRLWRVGSDGWYATPIARPHTYEVRGDYDANAFPVESPDGTKIAYSSTMLGDADLYAAVMRLPDPPRTPRTLSRRRFLRRSESLHWSPPRRAREVAGYLVWGGAQSGGPYERLSVEPIEGTSFAMPADAPAFLVVTAVEHSGLIGLPSLEVSRHRGDARTRVIRVEAESGRLTRPFALAFDGDFAGLYAIRVVGPSGGRARDALGGPLPWPIPGPSQGSAEIELVVHDAGRYRVWAYTRGTRGGAFELRGPRGSTGRFAASSNGWRWQPVEASGQPLELALAAGVHRFELATRDVEIEVDQLIFSNDPTYRPVGAPVALPVAAVPEPLASLREVEARALSPYACRLEWASSGRDDGGLVHVQRGRGGGGGGGRGESGESGESGGSVGTLRRVASVRGGFFVDQGLRPDTRYRYLLHPDSPAGGPASGTKVADFENVRGVEKVQCVTPPRAQPVQLQVRPRRTQTGFALGFDLPQAGRYAMWALLRARESRPSSRQARLCLNRGESDCQREEALFARRWVMPLGPIRLPKCCPAPFLTEEWIWVAIPLSSSAPAEVANLASGPHTLAFEPEDEAAFEICMAVVTNDESFVPADDQRLPKATRRYGGLESGRGECPLADRSRGVGSREQSVR